MLPGCAETNVRKTDAAVEEEVSDTGQGEKPGEDLVTGGGGLVDEGEETEEELEDDGRHWATLAVDLGEELRGHAGGGHGLDGTGGRISGGVGHRDDGDGDDGVEDGRETLDAGHGDGKHEGRSLGVGAGRAEKNVGAGGDDEAEDEKVDDIEEEDAPEHLSCRSGNVALGVRSLSSSETGHFGTSVGKRRRDEHRAETLEAIAEGRLGSLPVSSTDVATIVGRHTSAVDNDTEDDEANTGGDLNDAEDEFDFTVAADTEDLYDCEDGQEDSDPDSDVVIAPELDRDGSSCDFERQHSKPLDGVLPAHSETPV